MKIKCVWEHNGDDTILYANNFIGAFTRGESREIALEKMSGEVSAYLRWCGKEMEESFVSEIVQEKSSSLQIKDADTDILFEEERNPLSLEEYTWLKELVMKSANDFFRLYEMIPDKNKTCLEKRMTFYGSIPRTATEMYEHTKNVNSYYWGEIGVSVDNDDSIVDCRKRGFEILERTAKFLNNEVFDGSYNEQWSLRKVLRRFIWHDRIHAKAMYRMAIKTFGEGSVEDIFRFNK